MTVDARSEIQGAKMLAMHKERYVRQAELAQVGWHGQERFAAATVVIIGCGALGTVSAELLARAGVGRLRLVDDDCVELANLVRQTLYDEEDARTGQPKVMAAARKLSRLNPTVTIEPVVARLNARNAKRLVAGADLVLDGTDNDAARYLINETCVKLHIPWIFAAVLENCGLMMNIVPGVTPCFACVFNRPSRRSGKKNCKGGLASVTHVVASLQVGQAYRLLLGDNGYSRGLVYADAWEPSLEKIQIADRREGCPTCGDQ